MIRTLEIYNELYYLLYVITPNITPNLKFDEKSQIICVMNIVIEH